MPTISSYPDDYYDRLGVAPTDTARLIRRQFRLLARLHHPDVSDAPDAKQHFLALQEAYSILGDEAKRRDYDGWLKRTSSSPLHMEFQLSPTQLVRSFGRQRIYALLELEAREEVSFNRVPLNVVLVLDRSSSMRGERLACVKEATRQIVSGLSPMDVFGLVAFHDRAQVILPSGPSVSVPVANSAIDGIRAFGGTEIATGMRAGLRELLKHHHSKGISHLILLTDGHTYGDEQVALELATLASQKGIGITAMGLGSQWSDDFLDDLTQRADGRAHFIARAHDAVSLFQSQIQQLQSRFARNTTLSCELGAGVQLLQAHEVAPGLRELSHEGQQIHLGAWSAEMPIRLLLEFAVELPARDLGVLSRFTLSAELIQTRRSYQTQRLAIVDVGEKPVAPPEDIYHAAQRVATLRMQHHAWERLAKGETQQGTMALDTLAQRFFEMGSTDLALTARRELRTLKTTGMLSELGRKTIKYGTRQLALPAPSGKV